MVIICMDWFMVTHFSDCESYNELLLFREESKIFLPIKQRRYMATRIAAPPSHYYIYLSQYLEISSAGASPCYVQINIQIFCENSYLMNGYLIFLNLILY